MGAEQEGRRLLCNHLCCTAVRAQEWDKLWALNKKIVDPVCPRHTAVAAQGRVRLRLNNGPAQPEVVAVPKHKKHPPAGVKATTRTKARTPLACAPCRPLLG